MMKNKKWPFIFLTLLLQKWFFAEQHTFGIGYEVEKSRYSTSQKPEIAFQFKAIDMGQVNLFDNYHWNKNWAIEWIYLDRNSSDAIHFMSFSSESSLNYQSISSSLKYSYPLSTVTSLYSTLGLHRYTYEMKKKLKTLKKDQGIDLIASMGIEFTYSNGLGLYAHYRYIQFDSVIGKALLGGVGFYYRF
jgi:hypothetical protein